MEMYLRITQIDIDGSEVQIYEKMYDYVCNANFFHYADEVVDASAYGEHDAESMLPKVLVRKINLYKDVNFLLGTVLHQLDQKIIYPHYDFKHLTEKYFEIGMKLRNS